MTYLEWSEVGSGARPIEYPPRMRALTALVLLWGCGTEAARPSAPPPPAPAPQPASLPAPAPIPPARAFVLDHEGRVHVARSDGTREPLALPVGPYARALGPAWDEGVVVLTSETEVRPWGLTVIGRDHREHIGQADGVWLAPDGRTLVLLQAEPRGTGHSIAMEQMLFAWSLDRHERSPIGGGRFLGFASGGVLAMTVRARIGGNDAVVGHDVARSLHPLPGAPRPGPAPDRIPLEGAHGARASIDFPQPLGGICALRIAGADVEVVGPACDHPFFPAWSADGSKIAFIDRDRNVGRLRVLDREGRALGTLALGEIPERAAISTWGQLALAPDGSEVAAVAPDGRIVRARADGTRLGEVSAGRLRGYDPSGRYLLVAGPPSTTMLAIRGDADVDLGDVRDAVWAP